MLSTEQTYKLNQIPAHGCGVLAVRLVNENLPVYLGSDLHISQGMEVAEWDATNNSVNATLRLPRKAGGILVLKLPGENWEVTVNERAVVGKPLGGGAVEIPVVVEGFAHLDLRRK
jgi:hypothetical protein